MTATWKAAAVVLALAGVLRVWGAFDIAERIDDEPLHVPTAMSLGAWGTTTHSNWAHPPLSGLLLYGSIALLGDNPHGWRSSNVLLGSLTVLMLFLVGSRLYPGRSAPLLAAALLALDPFHIYHSRTTFMEVPVTFFFLAFLYFTLEYTERGRRLLPLAGIAAGLTMATKAYFVAAIPLTVTYACLRGLRRGEKATALASEVFSSLVLLPIAVYLLCHVPWFSRGYTLLEFVRMKGDALRAMEGYTLAEFFGREWLEAGGRPWEWFVKPFFFGSKLSSAEGSVRYLLEVNNFPFRIISIPALLLTAAYAWRRRDAREALAPALFAACYALFLAVDRPLFSYSAMVVLPFAYLATARAVDSLSESFGRPALVRGAFLAIVALWGAYTFPLAAGRSAPGFLYDPILPLMRILGGS